MQSLVPCAMGRRAVTPNGGRGAFWSGRRLAQRI